MANKNIQIKFDIDNKDLEIASKSVMSVVQQIRFLKKELASGTYSQEQFEIMSKKLGDLEDGFAKTRARSGDFLMSLQLIPGPVGEIASKLNGAIGLLKTFSGFKLSDLKFQLKETADDIKGIFESLGSWGEKTQEVTDDQKDLNDVTAQSTQVNTSAGQAILQTATANQKAIEGLQEKIRAESLLGKKIQDKINTLEKEKQGLEKGSEAYQNVTRELQANNKERVTSTLYLTRYTEELNALTNTQKTNTTAAKKDAVAQTEVAAASETASKTTDNQTKSTNLLTTAQNAASTSGRILKGVLASLGIGLIIALVTGAVTKFVQWAQSIYSTEKASKNLDDSIQQLNRTLENNLALVDEEIEIQKIRAQVAGKSEKDINDITIQGINRRIEEYKKGRLRIQKELQTVAGTYQDEDRRKEQFKTLTENFTELGKQISALESKRRIQEVQGEKILADEKKKINKDSGSEQKQLREQELAEIVSGRKEAFMSLLTEQQREEYVVNEKYLKLERLAIKYNQDIKGLEEGRQKELSNIRKKYNQEDLDIRIESINAIIETEQNAADVDIVRLEKLLLHKRDLELQNEELIGEQRQAIISRYEKQIRDLQTKDREDRLVKEIDANRGNFDKQIQLLEQFQEEVKNSEKYTAGEKLRILKETNDQIQTLQQERFDEELNTIQLGFDNQLLSQNEYYNQLFAAYDKEELRYKQLRESGQITDAQYTEFLKKNNQTRRQLDQEELDAKMANFQAVSQLFAASAALVGEQTKAGKTLAIASATIDTYVAANQALRQEGVPPLIKAIQAAAVIIRGLTNVKKIVEVPIPTFGGGTDAGSPTTKPMGTINVNAQKKAQGGIVSGPGSETSDSIPAMLSNGEYVINARSTRMFQPILSAINNYGLDTPSFAAGGLVMGSQTSQQTQNSQSLTDVIQQEIRREPIRTYVTSQDVTNQQQFDRIIKSRSLI